MKLISYDSDKAVIEVEMLGGRMALTVEEAIDYGRYPYHTAIELRGVLLGLGIEAPDVPESLDLAREPGKPKPKLTDEEQREADARQAAYERQMEERRKNRKVKK